MTASDLKDLAGALKYQKTLAMDNCITFGEKGENFYIIIQGIVSVSIPNPQIKERALQLRDFEQLLEWKEKEFDPKVERAKK